MKKAPKIIWNKRDLSWLPATQMITRARRRSLNYNNIVKIVEEVSKRDEKDPVILLA
jgi:hypothetical protein